MVVRLVKVRTCDYPTLRYSDEHWSAQTSSKHPVLVIQTSLHRLASCPL